jgi:hypothetical protein
MRVGFDLDGVGYVFGASVRNYLTSIGINVAEATDDFCTHWDFYEFWGMTREEFAKYCDAGVDAGFVFAPGDGLTRPGFFDAIKTVKMMGHDVIIATHRFQGSPGKAQENTYRWLEPVLMYVDEVHFTTDGDKTGFNTDMFVEDSKPNYDLLVASGQDSYLINRPWNAPYNDDRQRIGDIYDYVRAVEQRAKRVSVV